MPSPRPLLRRVQDALFAPEDIASLVILRFVLGGILAVDAFRYLQFGWIRQQYLEPMLTLKFPFFEWVKVLSPFWMHGVFGLMFACGLAIGVGLCYRAACVLYALAHTYVFLAEAAHYLNHAYLISVFMLLMAFIPAHRSVSLDASVSPKLWSDKVPAWPRLMLRGIIVVVYLFGAIAKMNPDWFAGEPVRHWMVQSAGAAPAFKGFIATEQYLAMVIWGGLFFDLLIGPTLLWKRTRWLGVLGSAMFHLSNAYLFNIGVFPWFMLLVTTLFLEPDWPRHLPFGLGRRIAEGLKENQPDPLPDSKRPGLDPSPPHRQRVTYALMALAAFNVLVPLRHHLYPDDVAWTDEAHNFSWRMKLRDKTGWTTLHLRDKKSGETWTLHPSEHLTDRQQRKIVGRPDMVLDYVHQVRDMYARQGRQLEIRVDAWAALNYRVARQHIDPKVDLAAEPKRLGHYPWVLASNPHDRPQSAVLLVSNLSVRARKTLPRLPKARLVNPFVAAPLVRP